MRTVIIRSSRRSYASLDNYIVLIRLYIQLYCRPCMPDVYTADSGCMNFIRWNFLNQKCVYIFGIYNYLHVQVIVYTKYIYALLVNLLRVQVIIYTTRTFKHWIIISQDIFSQEIMTLLPTRQPINTDVVPHTSNSDDIEIMVPIDYNVIIFDIYSDDTFSEPPKRL